MEDVVISGEILFSTEKVGDYWLVRMDFVEILRLCRKMPLEKDVREVNEKFRGETTF